MYDYDDSLHLYPMAYLWITCSWSYLEIDHVHRDDPDHNAAWLSHAHACLDTLLANCPHHPTWHNNFKSLPKHKQSEGCKSSICRRITCHRTKELLKNLPSYIACPLQSKGQNPHKDQLCTVKKSRRICFLENLRSFLRHTKCTLSRLSLLSLILHCALNLRLGLKMPTSCLCLEMPSF
jgi:hypothetical protein